MTDDYRWTVVLRGDGTPPSDLNAIFRREAEEWAMLSPHFEALEDSIEVWNLATQLLAPTPDLSVKEVVQRILEPEGVAYVINSPFSSIYIGPNSSLNQGL